MSPSSVQANWLNVSITQPFHTRLFQIVPYSWNATPYHLPNFLSLIIQIAHAIPSPLHNLPKLVGKGLIASPCTISVSISHLRLPRSLLAASILNFEVDTIPHTQLYCSVTFPCCPRTHFLYTQVVLLSFTDLQR